MLNLGTLQFGLAVNTRALDAAVQRFQSFGQSVSAVQRAANRGIDTNISQFRRQENAILSAMEKLKSATNQISRANITPELKTKQIEEAGRLFNQLTKNIGQAGKAADATKFDRSVAAYRSGLNDLIRQTSNLATVSASSAKTTESALLRQANAYERAVEKVRNLNAQIERSKLNVDTKTSLTAGPDAAIGNLKTALSGGALNPAQYSEAFNNFNRAIGQTRRQFQDASAKANTFTSAMEKTRDTLRGLGSGFLLVNGHLGGMSTRMIALSNIASTAGVKIAAAAAGVVGFSTAISVMSTNTIKTVIGLEKTRAALEAIQGNSIDAANSMDFVRTVADRAGVSFNETAQSYSRYLAAAKSVNQSAQQTQDQFRVISLATGKLSLGIDDTVGVFRAFEQILSKGKVQSEELRGQLGDRLPAAFAIAADAMGVTVSKLSDMLKKGEVLSSDFVPKFVKAIQKAYNIDVSKPVDTTQAAITRLSTQLTFMYEAFNNATKITSVFKNTINGLTSLLATVTTNMSQIIETVTGLTGAIFGAVAGFVAMRGAIIGLAVAQALITWMTSFVTLAAAARSATELWTLAQTALNVAMIANPVGALIGLIVKLTFVLGGAYLGYKYFTDAIKANTSSLQDTSGIESWIEGQKKLRTATDEATMSMIKQQKIQLAAAQSTLAEAHKEFRKAQESYTSAMHPKTIFGGEAVLSEAEKKMREFTYGPAVEEARKKGLEAADAVNRQAKAVQGLIDVYKTPMAELPKILDISGDSGDTSKAQDNINNILDLIDRYKAAKEKLASLSQIADGRDILKIDDIADARAELRRLNDNELLMAAKALEKAGLWTNSLEASLTNLNTTIRTSEEQSRAFIKVWQDIDRGKIELKNLKDAVAFLEEGGDPRQLYFIKAMSDAEDALRKLDGPHLEGVRAKLKAMGYEGNTAAEALAKFFSAADQADQLRQALTSIAQAQEQANDRLNDAVKLAAAYGNNAWTGEAMQRLLNDEKTVREFERALRAAGYTSEQTAAAVQQLWATLSAADQAEEGLRRVQERSEQVRQSFYDMASSFASNIIEMVKGAQTLGQVLKDTALNFVFDSAKTALNNIFNDALDSLFKRNKSRDQAEAISKNVNALDKNTVALLDLVRALGKDATSGTGGLGSLFDAIGSAVGGKDSKGSSFISSALSSIAGSLFGRAGGGPVTQGKAYRVTEQGAGSEIFFPGTSGTIVPLSKMGGGTTVHYDGRTTIDARGATQESVESLRRLMNERDARLRAELPNLIDNRFLDSSRRGRLANA